MLRRTILAAAAGIAVAGAPAPAFAQDEDKSYDARLEGHTENVTLDVSGTALSYLLLAGLGVLCVGVMFKNARRSHLD